METKENDDDDDQQSAKDDQSSFKDDQSSNKDDQSSIKDELADSDNDSESDGDGELKQEEEAKSDQEEIDSDEEMNEKKSVKRKEADEIFGDSDSENEDEIEPSRAASKRKLDSSNEDSDDEFFSPKKKKPARLIKDSDEEQSDLDAEIGDLKRKLSDSDDELENELKELDNQEDNQDENGEQTEKQDDENQGEKDDDAKKVLPDISSSSEDELEDDQRNRSDLVYDFDIMMAKRKEQNARNRKRRNTDLINDSDDFIAHLLSQMKQAAEEDFELNRDRKAATRKMKLLPSVQAYLRKIDLRESFLDSGVLGIIADWLTRLPDGSLPNLQVRETMLKILLEMNIMDVDRLKSSGIGKAVMYLFKHPKETKDNKRKASQLIMNWSRPIFNCETDYQSISKEDREQRDYDLMHKVQRKRGDEAASSQQSNSANDQAVLRPGDKGWIPRARVPMPSTKDYVVRPKSTVEIEIAKSSKRQATRLDKHLRSFQEKKRSSKMQRAVKISIEGRKL